MWYPKEFNTNQTLYKAIADAIERDIHQSILKQGDKLPPQRQLAAKIGVNLTTITRAYNEAIKRDLIESRKGDGTYVKLKNSNSNPVNLKKHTNSGIEFGFANPGSVSTEPLKKILGSITEDPAKLEIFNYVENRGLKRHREIASKWLTQYGFRNINANQVVITNGAMNGIICVLIGILSHGDILATDTLTFAGLKRSALLHGIETFPIEMDEEGMMPGALDKACERTAIKAVYLMPNMHNPTARVMSDKRKAQIAEVIERRNLLLIEDDIFSLTNLDSISSISTMIPHRSFFICGLSKVLYPGLRIAFAKVPDQYYHQYVDALVHTVWMASPLNAEILAQLIENGDIHKLSADMRALISKRQSYFREILIDAETNIALSKNQESMYIWMTLPEKWSPEAFEHASLIKGVRVIAANKFFVGSVGCPNAIRISLTSEPNQDLFEEGVHKIKELLRQSPQIVDAIM